MKPHERLGAHALVWLIAWIVLEAAGFFLLKNRYLNDEKNLAYSHDATLGWFPEKNSQKIFQASKKISVHHNGRGFRDINESQASTDKPKIAFIGDSFVWGFDVEEGRRFTDLLRSELPDHEVLNWGVSGYGTDQEYLLLQREWPKDRPETVFLVFSGNDRMDNSSDRAYGYFKPYFQKEGDSLFLKGVPVPANAMFLYKNLPEPWRRSTLALIVLKIWEKSMFFLHKPVHLEQDPTLDLIRAIRIYLESRGARFILAMVDKDEEIERYCREESAFCVDLSSLGASYRFRSYGSHWNPQGHEAVSRLFGNFVKTGSARA